MHANAQKKQIIYKNTQTLKKARSKSAFRSALPLVSAIIIPFGFDFRRFFAPRAALSFLIHYLLVKSITK